MSVAIATNWEQRLADLGNIPVARIQTRPAPGMETLADLLVVNENQGRMCELVDLTLVDRATAVDQVLIESRTIVPIVYLRTQPHNPQPHN